MPKADTLADRLRRLRLAAGMSQAQLAERSGLSLRAVTDLEQGLRTDPRASTVQALARALGVTMESLLAG